MLHFIYYSTNIRTEYFKHATHSPFFSLQNAVYFITLPFLVPVLFTFYIQIVLKLKKKSGAKRLIRGSGVINNGRPLHIFCSFNGNLKRDRWPVADRLHGTIPPVVDSGGSIQFCWHYLVLIVTLMGNGKSVVPLCNFRVSMQLIITGIICCISRRTQRSTGPNLTGFKH